MAMDYFPCYNKYSETCADLTDEQFGRVMRALIHYNQTGELPPLSGVEAIAARFMVSDIDGVKDAYQKRCEKNASNAKKGGRPPKEEKPNGFFENQSVSSKTEKTERFFEKPKKPNINLNKNLNLNNPPKLSNESLAPPPPEKAKKSTEPKVQWAENVTMTNVEHDKLLATYGPADTDRLVEILDNYKGSSGRRYKSDYRAILSWGVDRLYEEKRRAASSRGQGWKTSNPFLEMLEEEQQRGGSA